MPRYLDRAHRPAMWLVGDQSGVTSIEYAMIALFIALVLITALELIGSRVSSIFMSVGSGL